MLSILERPSVAPQNATAFVIEANIPVPPRAGGRAARYPFALMQIGDSFEVPLSACRSKQPTLAKFQETIHNAARHYTKTRNRSAKFTVRKTGETTLRVWRIA